MQALFASQLKWKCNYHALKWRVFKCHKQNSPPRWLHFCLHATKALFGTNWKETFILANRWFRYRWVGEQGLVLWTSQPFSLPNLVLHPVILSRNVTVSECNMMCVWFQYLNHNIFSHNRPLYSWVLGEPLEFWAGNNVRSLSESFHSFYFNFVCSLFVLFFLCFHRSNSSSKDGLPSGRMTNGLSSDHRKSPQLDGSDSEQLTPEGLEPDLSLSPFSPNCDLAR